ncbi:MAG: zf-HC2 domain-containing protein [Sedimentisphaerales bacterium]|nr:zf-HC2 domain-containing protein [Sedimentisphaerales bacterium]
MNNQHEKMKDKITDYVLGILNEDEIANLEKHIEQCSECKEHLESLKKEREIILQFGKNIDSKMKAREENVMAALEKFQPKKSVHMSMLHNRIFKFAAAAMIVIGILVIFQSMSLTGKVYALTDVPGLIEKAKTLHVKTKYYTKVKDQTLDFQTLEYWYDIENGRMYYLREVEKYDADTGLEIPLVTESKRETVWDENYVMKLDDKKKTAMFNKLLSSQKQANQKYIMQLAMNAMQDWENLDSYRKVDVGQIDGHKYDIWRREFNLGDSGIKFRYETWVSPATGDIGLTKVWSKMDRDEWELHSETDVFERNVQPQQNIFSTQPPNDFAVENTKENADISYICFDIYGGSDGYKFNVQFSYCLEDGSIVTCWRGKNTNKTTDTGLEKAFEELRFGDKLPLAPIGFYGLLWVPENNTQGQIEYYVGRHILYTQKADNIYEWAVYVPENKPKTLNTLVQNLAFIKIESKDITDSSPRLYLMSLKVEPEEFNNLIHGAYKELSDNSELPENVNYENILNMAKQIPDKKELYSNFKKEIQEQVEHVGILESVEIVLPEDSLELVKQTTEEFFKAINEGRDNDAMRLLRYEEERASSIVKNMKQMPGIDGIKVDDIYIDEKAALVITSEFGPIDNQYGCWAISLIKEKGLWIIRDFDAPTAATKSKEVDKFLEPFPNATHFPQ